MAAPPFDIAARRRKVRRSSRTGSPLNAAFAPSRPPAPAPIERPSATDRGRRPHAPRAPHLGNEPPLDLSAQAATPIGRHAVSLRWLGASILAGIAGSVLLGSAIWVSSEGEWTFAEPAERATVGVGRAAGAGPNETRKGDKLVRTEMVAAAKQTFRSPVTIRTGDREVIKVRSFVRIATNLSVSTGTYATDIPPFNPLRFFSDSGGERIVDTPPETSDAEVSVVKTDLLTLGAEPSPAALTDDQVVAQLVDETRLRLEAGRRSAAPLPSAALLSRMLGQASAPSLEAPPPAAGQAPFRSIEVLVVPENVTISAKAGAGAADAAFEERTVTIRRGDTLESVLRDNGAGAEDTRIIAATLIGRDRTFSALEGMQMRLLLAAPTRPTEARRMVRAILFGENGVEAIAAMNDRGSFVSVTPPQTGPSKADSARDDDDADEETGGVSLYASLYETALKQDLPRQTVEELVRIFGYDVDFQRRVTPGDGFELFYALDDEAGIERVEILSATLTVGSDTHRVYRYQAEDGSVEYFDDAGRSLKKFLIRKPVVEARLSSGFGIRYHPILRYAKPHTGVDWATKAGTPIFSAGNGTILKAGYDSGYGRRVEIQHANGYVTTYNHMSAFGRTVAPGVKVRQGQVIGFVGSTGLSTGAHLHFEVIVNGHFVDPMKIRVPRGRELDGRALVDFRRQRDQTDGLMQKAGSANRFAQRAAR